MDNAVVYVLPFIVGFLTGASLCYAILAQIYKHKRVRDELLKSRRDAVKAKRTLDRFLKTSLDMFSDLDLAHRQYAMFLKETAQRLAPQEEPVHEFMKQKYPDPVFTRGDDKENEKHETVVQEAQEEPVKVEEIIIPAPKELQSQATDIDGQQSNNVEIKEEEKIEKL